MKCWQSTLRMWAWSYKSPRPLYTNPCDRLRVHLPCFKYGKTSRDMAVLLFVDYAFGRMPWTRVFQRSCVEARASFRTSLPNSILMQIGASRPVLPWLKLLCHGTLWSQTIDDSIRTAFTRITDTPIEMGSEAFLFPPAEAGVGFTSLRSEAVAHFVAQLLADRQKQQDSSYQWTWADEQAFHCYEVAASSNVHCSKSSQF
eukprot:657961-Amphidinium_carterae.5